MLGGLGEHYPIFGILDFFNFANPLMCPPSPQILTVINNNNNSNNNLIYTLESEVKLFSTLFTIGSNTMNE